MKPYVVFPLVTSALVGLLALPPLVAAAERLLNSFDRDSES